MNKKHIKHFGKCRRLMRKLGYKGESMALSTDKLNRTVFISDNLPFLKGIDTESIDLVIIDPPFAKNQTFEGKLTPPLTKEEKELERNLLDSWGASDPDSAYELGLEYPDQEGQSAKFQDIWNFHERVYEDWLESLKEVCPGAYLLIHSTRYTHSDAAAAYIAFMVERVLEIKRIMKPTGSLYLHCDYKANAYLRQMLDAVFGRKCFRSEIVWAYRTGGVSMRYWPHKHDTIFHYAKSEDQNTTVHNPLQEREYYEKEFFNTKQDKEGRFYSDVYVRDVWDDVKPLINVSGERTGYPTQKPQALAKRIIEASSKEGDLVLDCFAGCAYVPVAAELTGRRWIACDMSVRAWTVVRRQFHKHPDLGITTEGGLGSQYKGFDRRIEHADKIIKLQGPHDLPKRTRHEEALSLSETLSVPEALTMPVVRDRKPRYKQRSVESNKEIWTAFVEVWGTACWYCGNQKLENPRELQLDHIEPSKRDGSNDDCWNRALACVSCNGDKGNKLTPYEAIDKAREKGRIQTDSLRDQQKRNFDDYHQWAVNRWEEMTKASPAKG